MVLKVNDTADFNLSMNLNINWELEYIEVTVSLENKKKNTRRTKTFPAAEFERAIAHFEEEERMFL